MRRRQGHGLTRAVLRSCSALGTTAASPSPSPATPRAAPLPSLFAQVLDAELDLQDKEPVFKGAMLLLAAISLIAGCRCQLTMRLSVLLSRRLSRSLHLPPLVLCTSTACNTPPHTPAHPTTPPPSPLLLATHPVSIPRTYLSLWTVVLRTYMRRG